MFTRSAAAEDAVQSVRQSMRHCPECEAEYEAEQNRNQSVFHLSATRL